MVIQENTDSSVYQPTEVQQARAAAQIRFNRLFVYVPLVLMTLLVLLLFGLMIYYAVIREDVRPLLSAVADLILIFILIPAIFLSILLPAGFVYIYITGREREFAPLQRTQTLLWRLDSLVLRIRLRWREIMPRIAGPVVGLNVQFVRVETLWRRVAGRERQI